MEKRKTWRLRGVRAVSAFIVLALTLCLSGCSTSAPSTGAPVYDPNTPSHSNNSSSNNTSSSGSNLSNSSRSSGNSSGPSSSSNSSGYGSAPSSVPEPETYEDPSWPTHNSQLLALPESQRWYNASAHVGTNCTIAGPVVNIYQAKDSKGTPVFVQIGAKYPDPDCVELVIWSDAYNDFVDMLNKLSAGSDPWIQVTGYLDSYNETMQFSSDDGVSYTYWPNAG